MSNPPLDELQWKSPEYIQHEGLRTDNVLSYFAESPFFDRTCNNQVLKMQSQFNDNIQMEQLNSINIINELKKMTGLEYIVLHTREPDFWIIRKQERLNSEETEPLADYYIIGANVYMSPNVKDVVSNRLLSTALALKRAVNKLQDLATFSPADGHSYKFQPNDSSTSGTASRTRPGVGNTPYTPSTSTPGINSNPIESQLTKGTIHNLFNVSLTGNPVYLDEE